MEKISAENLELYISFDRLKANDLGICLHKLSNLADKIVDVYCRRLDIRVNGELPTLDIESIQTGDSIKLKLTDSWIPTISSDKENDIVISTPKKLGIPLLIAYLLISGATQGLDIPNKILDIEVKQTDIINKKLDNKLKELDIKLKEKEIGKLLELDGEDKTASINNLHNKIPELKEMTSDTIKTIVENPHYEKFEVNGIDIKNIDAK